METKDNSLFAINVIDSIKVDESIRKFTEVVNEQYFKISNKSNRIKYNQDIVDQNLIEEELSLLEKTNYELAALTGERVILFDKPYLISEVFCYNDKNITDEKSQALRLISYKHTIKKVIFAKRMPTNLRGPRNQANLKYVVDEVILGAILPTHSTFMLAEALDLETYYRDGRILTKISQAREDIILSTNILKEEVDERISNVNAYLKEKKKTLNSFELQLESSLNEKNRLENSLEKETKIIERIRNDIKIETKNLDDVQAENERKGNQLKELNNQINSERSNFKLIKEQSIDTSEQLNSSRNELGNLQEQLLKARADINVTTLDMKGFSEESKKQISNYFWLAITSIVFLAIIFGFLYENATTFSDLFDANPTASAWNILLSRLPLITATALIIGTLSALLFYLVNNIISVNENKMNMLKASILAEQITGSLSKKDMTDEEIRDFKRNTKIELVMSVFSGRADNLKEEKQNDIIKQLFDALKSLKP